MNERLQDGARSETGLMNERLQDGARSETGLMFEGLGSGQSKTSSMPKLPPMAVIPLASSMSPPRPS